MEHYGNTAWLLFTSKTDKSRGSITWSYDERQSASALPGQDHRWSCLHGRAAIGKLIVRHYPHHEAVSDYPFAIWGSGVGPTGLNRGRTAIAPFSKCRKLTYRGAANQVATQAGDVPPG